MDMNNANRVKNTDMPPEDALCFMGEEAKRQGASHYDALAENPIIWAWICTKEK